MPRRALLAILAWCAVGAESAASSGADAPFVKTLKGPLQDAQCDVESVQTANAQQLSALLADVLEMSFFRKFRVVDDKCPFWETATGKKKAASAPGGGDDNGANSAEESHGDGGEPSCAETSAALGLAEPACSLSGVTDNPFSASAMGSSSLLSSPRTPKHSIPKGPSTDAVEGSSAISQALLKM